MVKGCLNCRSFKTSMCDICEDKSHWHDKIPPIQVDPVPIQRIDVVNHPSHYTSGGIETIEFLKAKLSKDGMIGYLTGNIMKYITRYNLKNGVEDLKKAKWYLDYLITFYQE